MFEFSFDRHVRPLQVRHLRPPDILVMSRAQRLYRFCIAAAEGLAGWYAARLRRGNVKREAEEEWGRQGAMIPFGKCSSRSIAHDSL